MQAIPNPDTFRANIVEKLVAILWDSPERMAVPDMIETQVKLLAQNLEKGIFNFSLQQADQRQIIKKWDNQFFVLMYIDRLRSVYTNLQKQPDLRLTVLTKTRKAHEIAFMTHQEMAPKQWAELLEEKRVRDENRFAPRIEAATDNFTCYKCRAKRCTYYQLQTRSADEPMTTFVTCLECGNRWKC